MDKMAEIKQRKREKLLALVGNKAPTMGQVNPNQRLWTIVLAMFDVELFSNMES